MSNIVLPISQALEDNSRYLDPLEMMSSQVLPVTASHARRCGAPKLELDGVPPSQISRMAGNSMNVQCVAAVCLTAILALEFR